MMWEKRTSPGNYCYVCSYGRSRKLVQWSISILFSQTSLFIARVRIHFGITALFRCLYFSFPGQCEPLRPLHEIWRTKCHIFWWPCIQWLNGMLIPLLLFLACSLLVTRILCGGRMHFCWLNLFYKRDWFVKCDNRSNILTRC